MKIADFVAVRTAYFLNLYLEALILFGGVLGNVIMFIVLTTNKAYQDVSMYVYLKVSYTVMSFKEYTMTPEWLSCYKPTSVRGCGYH